ncbi:agamous-like MADS-box protein AGL19 isoform X3 [Olea europaea var. sylvestris]|uniref:agamous-like MADS-box protein AGL19 isoform X3 n=1 Tax=Olea europaea var. sylvestris TaxID=158386 RepID=UPI000C1CD2BC|nr:agamous-like MADS-box protein AGL19 isoform X3 [Olea europaea var. sylvestris]
MVRGKTQMKRIENATSRQVTFSKRRSGLFKKAFELSVLCDAEVALIIFSPGGKLYEFSSSSVNKTIQRYQKDVKNRAIKQKPTEENIQNLRSETADLMRKIELLEDSKRKLLGDDLDARSMEELEEIEEQLQQSLISIRARKEKILAKQNKELRRKCEMVTLSLSIIPDLGALAQIKEAETALFIGPPEKRATN